MVGANTSESFLRLAKMYEATVVYDGHRMLHRAVCLVAWMSLSLSLSPLFASCVGIQQNYRKVE